MTKKKKKKRDIYEKVNEEVCVKLLRYKQHQKP